MRRSSLPSFLSGALALALSLLCPAVRAAPDPGAPAEPGRGAYTLADCLRVARERSLTLANARRDVERARLTVADTRAEALPSLDAAGSYTRLDDEPSVAGMDVPLGRRDNYAASLEAGQLLYSGGAVAAGLRAARAYVDGARHALAGEESRLERDVTKAFFGALSAEAAVAVASASVSHLELLADQARLRFERQMASEFDLLTARVRLSNERPVLIAARNRAAVARETLRTLAFLEGRDFALAGSLDCTPRPLDLQALLQTAVTSRPDLRQARSAIAMAAEAVTYARSGYRPELRGFGTYSGQNPGADDPSSAEWAWGWQAGLRLSWSLADGGKRRSALLSRLLEEQKARADFDALVRSIVLEVKTAHLTLETAGESLSATVEGVALARRALDIAGTRYAQGLSTPAEFADASLDMKRAELTRLEAQSAYQQAMADLRYACGNALPAPEETTP